MRQLTENEEMIYTTVKLTSIINNQEVGTGTGFYWFTSPHMGRRALCIISNAHVVRGFDAIKIRINLSDSKLSLRPNGKYIDCIINLDPEGIFFHPDDNIDLCAFCIDGILIDLEKRQKSIFFRSFSTNSIPSEDKFKCFDAIEDILMVGYPEGIIDDFNNRPMVRRGITATQVGIPYQGRPEFAIDIACFPGSSGSPVFITEAINSSIEFGMQNVKRHNLIFAGVLYGGPVSYPSVLDSTSSVDISIESFMHIGYVINSLEIIRLDRRLVDMLSGNI